MCQQQSYLGIEPTMLEYFLGAYLESVWDSPRHSKNERVLKWWTYAQSNFVFFGRNTGSKNSELSQKTVAYCCTS